MKLPALSALVSSFVVVVGSMAFTQTTQAPPAPALTDVYSVNFLKAAPGQAAALGEAIKQPNPATPMPDHFVVLRHQEGDDWDYAILRHLGATATVEPGPSAAAGAAPDPGLVSWHSDAYVAGPSWPEFTAQMGIGASGAGAVYTLGIHNPAPGHTNDLMTMLAAPASSAADIEMGGVFMRHIEGGPWLFLTISRYNSWEDFGADRAAAGAAETTATGWADIRQHSAFHRDTIADRIFPVR